MKKLSLAIAAVVLGAGVCGAEDKPAPETTKDKITLPKSVIEFTLVKLPAGKITIKDKDGKDKEVEIKPIWIGQTEVTWDEYDIFWEATDLNEAEKKAATDAKSRPSKPYAPPDRGWGRHGFPAGSMFPKEAKRYCEWLGKMTNHKYRLPTEAEWEYACRAGGPPVKLSKAELAKYAVFDGDQPQAVGTKDPNPWGLRDMLGNVAEWVIMSDGTDAVAGGSYLDEADDVHSGARAVYQRAWQKDDPQIPKGSSWLSNGGHVGFRLVRED